LLRFSERYGYVTPRQALQVEEMDAGLRNGIWNIVSIVLDEIGPSDSYRSSFEASRLYALARALYHKHFKLTLDRMPLTGPDFVDAIRNWFVKAGWYQVYDFLEFMVEHLAVADSKVLRDGCNAVMERDLAGYRFVKAQIVPIVDPKEVAEIESALKQSAGPVTEHLTAALAFLSDRRQPNYRKSVDESILAIEAAARSLSGKPKATLGDGLKALKIDIHPALAGAFSKLYGYTSDESGIRHAITEDGRAIDQADARYMLIACSAFANYLRAKGSEKLA
jgi:hypothetical protein